MYNKKVHWESRLSLFDVYCIDFYLRILQFNAYSCKNTHNICHKNVVIATQDLLLLLFKSTHFKGHKSFICAKNFEKCFVISGPPTELTYL